VLHRADGDHAQMMLRCLAIADDLSGAAEIAGIGHRFGLPARIWRDRPPESWDGLGLSVIDTDSRSLPATAAAGQMERFLLPLRGHPFDLIYKKTDSVLRGNVAVDSARAGELLERRRIVLVPQNPSRGRTISRGGTYAIAGTPLDQTDFARDPEHPARSADARTLLGDPLARCLGADDSLPDGGTIIGAGESLHDIAGWASRIEASRDLPSGSGDFFTALLAAHGLRADREPDGPVPGRRLLLCGSASDNARALPALAASHGVALAPLPDDVFSAHASLEGWINRVLAALERSPRVLAFIPQPLDRSATARLHAAIGDLAASVLARASVENLLLEGGATAAAVCRRMGWNAFDATGELAPGVVRLRSGVQTLIIKPGSYPWPKTIWENE
jgi:uncharacterized protein YgbK (DUF1537 family)